MLYAPREAKIKLRPCVLMVDATWASTIGFPPYVDPGRRPAVFSASEPRYGGHRVYGI